MAYWYEERARNGIEESVSVFCIGVERLASLCCEVGGCTGEVEVEAASEWVLSATEAQEGVSSS